MEGAVSGSGEGIVERSPTGRYLRFAEKLGSGSWKQVYRAYDTREGIEVAWNVVNLTGVPKYERNRIINEVRLLERLVHPNIISFHGSWVNRERQEVHFITEILSAGSLKSFIMKVQVIRWKIAKRWLKQILEGLAYMHSQGVIHRDLKCENIFIDGPSGDLRIGDMGLCTILRGNGPTLSVLGTPEFMAPDMYEEHISYDEKIDIYSFGMCMIELCTHETPYIECSDPTQIYRKVSNGEHPQSLNRIRSPEARNFILLCIGGKDGSGKFVRPSAVQLLSHPFLSADDADDDIIRIDPASDKNSVPTKSTMTVATSTTATASGVSALKDAPETKEKGGQEKQQVGGNASGGAADAKKEPEPEPEPERQEQKELSGVGSPSPSATSSVASRATPSTGSAASRATSSSGSAASKPTTSGGSRTSKASFSAGSALGSRASKAIVPHESPGVTKTTPQTTSQGSKAATVATTSSALSQMSFSSQQTEVTAEEMMQYQLHRQRLQQEQLKHQQLQLQQLHLHQQQLQQQQYQQQLPQQQLLQQFQLQQLAQQQQLQQQLAQQQQLQQQLAQQQQRQQLQQQPQPQPPQPQPQPPQPQPQQKKQKHFLVAAAILERADAEQGGMFSGQGTQPTVLPLVLTFPVQGRNQDVQFDFDLVQDDPIKVAREMVEDLGIPSDAVLEISETISGLANAARIKREARTQVLQQEQVDKEELLVQQMRDLTTQNMEQLEQQERQQLQIDQQQEQIDMQAQQHQDQKEALLKQQQNILLMESKRKAKIEAEQGVVASPGSEGASGVVGKDKEKDSSSDEGEFNKELARIDEGYLFSMAQARQVYDNRIIGLQKEQDERERLHLDAVEQHEKDKADFHDLVRETQLEENRRVDDLQREWDERREQLAKQRKFTLGEK